jgi:type III pantothenate kinase
VNADLVVDVGNTRIKWGRCSPHAVSEYVSLPASDPAAWQEQLELWHIGIGATWILTGVHPDRVNFLAKWLVERHQNVHVLQSAQQLPLSVALERPDQVGIDRLLNAVAVNTRRAREKPAVIVDAGSAVTVDWLDSSGTFHGGAIAPGFRLQTHALHNYTALLPLVQITAGPHLLPGASTREAIEGGVFWFVAGGINTVINRMTRMTESDPEIFLAGGDADLLAPVLSCIPIVWPLMTLEGIRLTALTMTG